MCYPSISCVLMQDHGLRSLSYHLNNFSYGKHNVSHTFWSRKHSESSKSAGMSMIIFLTRQSLKSFFHSGLKRDVPPEKSSKKTPLAPESSKTQEKIIKEEPPRKRRRRQSHSSESEDSDHDEALEQAFGVKRGRPLPPEDHDSRILWEHRMKEMNWRKQHLR